MAGATKMKTQTKGKTMSNLLLTRNAIEVIIWNPRRCSSSSAAFDLLSIRLGRTISIANWRDMSEEEGEVALALLEREYPVRKSTL